MHFGVQESGGARHHRPPTTDGVSLESPASSGRSPGFLREECWLLASEGVRRRERLDSRSELAALRYLTRYVEEAKPSLLDVAGVSVFLAERVARGREQVVHHRRSRIEPLVRARWAVGHKLSLAVGPPRPGLSNSEPGIGLEAASHTLGQQAETLAVGRKARHACILPTAESEDEHRHGTERCHPEADAIHPLPLLPGSFYRFRLRLLTTLIAVVAIPASNVGTAHSAVLVPMIGNGAGGDAARREDQHHYEHGRPSHLRQDTPPPRTATSCREPRTSTTLGSPAESIGRGGQA